MGSVMRGEAEEKKTKEQDQDGEGRGGGRKWGGWDKRRARGMEEQYENGVRGEAEEKQTDNRIMG